MLVISFIKLKADSSSTIYTKLDELTLVHQTEKGGYPARDLTASGKRTHIQSLGLLSAIAYPPL